MKHSDITASENHVIQSFAWANAAAKAAQGGLVATDKGKIGWQIDENKFFVLVDHTVPTWLPVNVTPVTVSTSAPSGGVHGDIWYEREA